MTHRPLLLLCAALAGAACSDELPAPDDDGLGLVDTQSDRRITVRRNGADVFTTTENVAESDYQVMNPAGEPCVPSWSWMAKADRGYQGSGSLVIEIAHDAPFAVGSTLTLPELLIVSKSDFDTGLFDFGAKAEPGVTTGTFLAWSDRRHLELTNARWCALDASGDMACTAATETVEVLVEAIDGGPYPTSPTCAIAEVPDEDWIFSSGPACTTRSVDPVACGS